MQILKTTTIIIIIYYHTLLVIDSNKREAHKYIHMIHEMSNKLSIN